MPTLKATWTGKSPNTMKISKLDRNSQLSNKKQLISLIDITKSQKKVLKQSNGNKYFYSRKQKRSFNDKFKGFEYNVGDKKYRFNVNDTLMV